MSESKIIEETHDAFEKALQHLQDILRSVRTGRASSAIVDNIRVDYYGTQTPINQLAAVSVPEPRQIVIKPFDASVLDEISKAIMKSDLGINPQSDGKVLRLSMPALSGDQRKKYASKVKDMVEDTRVAMRNGRREMNKKADAALKDSTITEDENRKLHERIQESLKEYEKKLDGILEHKTAEIMEV